MIKPRPITSKEIEITVSPTTLKTPSFEKLRAANL